MSGLGPLAVNRLNRLTGVNGLSRLLLGGAASCALLGAAVLPSPVGGVLAPGIAHAQSDEPQRPQKPETRKAQTISSQELADRLQAISEALQNDNYGEAQRLLRQFESEDDLNDYEKALVAQAWGFLYLGKEDYRNAIRRIEESLSYNAFVEAEVYQNWFTLAQLNLIIERTDEALRYLRQWFAVAESPRPQAYITLAQAYVQNDEWGKAIEPVETAIRLTLEAGEQPQRGWYEQLGGLYFQTEQFTETLRVLDILIDNWPNERKYWEQMGGILSTLEREREAFGVLKVMYDRGWLTTHDDLFRLAQLYMFYENPIRAAIVIEDGLEKDILERSEETWETLASAYMAAREFDKAVRPLREAARLSDEGNLYFQLAQTWMQQENWEKAAEALELALDKGGLDDPGMARISLGVAHFNLENFEDARTQFTKASKIEKVEEQAYQWINHIDRTLENRAILAEREDAQRDG